VKPATPLTSPRASAAACCALGLLPGGLPGRLVRVGAGTLQLSLSVIGAGRFGRVLRPGRVLPGLADPGLGLGRPGLRARHRIIPFLLRRRHLLLRGPPGPGSPCLRGPCLLLGGGLRLQRLRQPRLGLPRGQTRLPPISLGLLGRHDLRLEPGPQLGPVPLGVLAGLRHLLLRGPAAPVQLRPSRLGRLPRLGQPRLSARLLREVRVMGSSGPSTRSVSARVRSCSEIASVTRPASK